MGVPVRDFLKKRRDRAVGSILGFAERNLFESLTPSQQKAFRENVLSALNMYHDTVLDLVSVENGVVRNDHLVDVLEAVERRLRHQQREAAVHSAP